MLSPVHFFAFFLVFATLALYLSLLYCCKRMRKSPPIYLVVLSCLHGVIYYGAVILFMENLDHRFVNAWSSSFRAMNYSLALGYGIFLLMNHIKTKRCR